MRQKIDGIDSDSGCSYISIAIGLWRTAVCAICAGENKVCLSPTIAGVIVAAEQSLAPTLWGPFFLVKSEEPLISLIETKNIPIRVINIVEG